MVTGTPKAQEQETTTMGTQVPFESIHEPGTYICNWSGHLLRIPDDAVSQGRSPPLNILGREPLFTTKISEDPFITVTKARLIAANHDVAVLLIRRRDRRSPSGMATR